MIVPISDLEGNVRPAGVVIYKGSDYLVRFINITAQEASIKPLTNFI